MKYKYLTIGNWLCKHKSDGFLKYLNSMEKVSPDRKRKKNPNESIRLHIFFPVL